MQWSLLKWMWMKRCESHAVGYVVDLRCAIAASILEGTKVVRQASVKFWKEHTSESRSGILVGEVTSCLKLWQRAKLNAATPAVSVERE